MLDDVYLAAPGRVPPEAAAEFDLLLAELDGLSDDAGPIDLTGRTARPVWQLLVHAAATGRFALHGSGTTDIRMFEPRQANDVDSFGDRRGVYAAADGLWPFYFAIVDRTRVTSLLNAAFTLADPATGAETGPWYFFSVDSPDAEPWRDGAVYLMPVAGFERQPEREHPAGRLRILQLFHPGEVRPVAVVRVRPAEFPLLDAIRHHDQAVLGQRAVADPHGFPWL
ncbi:hypothetical protein [Pseudactinotalea suaedae]|uniref:hypothetical protein n=1 Tax=Pseudactinotalea suaedae TaxID=1524924 RepID=UPI0012E2767F|nr:hypothetical protein [Pseudactinotalea suaedae]